MPEPLPQEPAPREPVRTYKVRRRVTTGQAGALARLLPRYGVDPDAPLDPVATFGRRAPLVVEIGSGMGEATAAMAAADPGRDVLAVEVHTPGLGNLLRLVEAAGLTNVRVVEADAREVLRDLLTPGSVDEVRVFFPDPWPKARHAKRRLVSAAFADLVAERLRPGGRLHVATDWPAYADGATAVLAAHPAYDVVSRERGARPITRFEQRGTDAGRASADLVARRR
ncbi:MAG: tRNA (guanosine(46)-N7)-methyltransferase TrmB [Frankiaceae bacterium]|nr:tRNA (guanosine(46)-N7)-methyltransferase TrmB [Frankiaceae bacterium]